MLAESTRYPLQRLSRWPAPSAQLESPFWRTFGVTPRADPIEQATPEGAQQARDVPAGTSRIDGQAGRGLRLLVDGPSSTVPSAVNREPCKRQSQDFSRSLKRTMPPRCVQMAETAQVLPATVEIATGSPHRTDYPNALGRRPILLFQRVKLGIKPPCAAATPMAAFARKYRKALAGLLTRVPRVRAQDGTSSKISPLMRIAAATALVMPHLLYPVARYMWPPPRGSLPTNGTPPCAT